MSIDESEWLIEDGHTSMNSASSSVSLGSSISCLMGLIAVFLPRAFRALFTGCSADFSIRGVERQSRKIWKFDSS